MPEHQTLSFWRGRLPHWEVVDGTYFVTLRVTGCLPASVRRDLDATLANANEKDYHQRSRQYFAKLEQWLDHHHETDWLTRTNVAGMLESALEEYEKQGVWTVHAYTILPNHMHWFFSPGDRSMSQAVKGFKRFTARQGNVFLNRVGRRFWQREWFDHWSRGARESDRIIHYIRENAIKAGLASKTEDWPYVK